MADPLEQNRYELEMTRVGSFTVESFTGSAGHKCGDADRMHFIYRAEIETDAAQLDPEGFVMDNRAVQDYFTRTFRHIDGDIPSCEQMAIQAVTDLRKLCAGRAKRIAVTVDGTGEAGLTARWQRGDHEPARQERT